MNKINIYFVNKTSAKPLNVNIRDNDVKLKLYYKNLDNYNLFKEIGSINNILNMYSGIKKVNLVFNKTENDDIKHKILSKTHDLLFSYNNINKIKLHNTNDINKQFIKELDKYKGITMHPNKNPDTYKQYIIKNIPSNYTYKIKNTSETFFPLSHAVASGSNYDSYFVHIYPKKINKKNTNVYIVGKSVTYDSGGLNLKGSGMYSMKVDMIGGAMSIAVLNLLEENNNVNFNILLPVVENMISSKATRAGQVITSMSGKKVEIINTDAEGRLCMADCLDYIQMKLLNKKQKNLIIDIATLTGATASISDGVASIVMSNESGSSYMNKIINVGENIGEYLDTVKLRKEYMDRLHSNVADIKNIDYNTKSGTVLAGQFLDFFVPNDVPWIHLDVASTTYKNNTTMSHGVNLLYEFISKL
jgi:leucyl aminopeptidase